MVKLMVQSCFVVGLVPYNALGFGNASQLLLAYIALACVSSAGLLRRYAQVVSTCNCCSSRHM